MKKKIVLIVLFILPLSAYIYFSLAKHNQLFLPVVTKNVAELPAGKTLDANPIGLQGKITIIGFLGNDMLKKKETIFNINQKINEKYKGFTDFQMVMLLPEGEQEKVKQITSEIKVMADISNWKFLFTSPENIAKFYQTLKVKEPLNADFGTYNLFIVDKDRSLRGRKGENPKTGKDEYKDSYNSLLVAELHNEMTDDIKILLREYRLALKKNNDLKGVKREI
ncbi:hypothetical protein AMR72_07615 [Flavobacterium psychrophilum]|nr:hypothetical protein AMR72_07615 [Flavobacterium psychrophilum]AOE52388.1 hypothetical protein ALW18_07605 [Flavobacterium psychrophilum]